MSSARFSKLAVYTLSTLLVLIAVSLLNQHGLAGTFFSVYGPIAFFTVVGLDLHQCDADREAAFYADCGQIPQSAGVYQDQYGFVRVAPIGINAPFRPATNRPQGLSFTDRFLAYIFTAPFILPARLYQLAGRR